MRFHFTGWLLLAWYVGFFSPAGLWLAVLLGSLDPEHQVQMHSDGRGQQIVLHHEGDCRHHHHGLVANALTFFAQPPSPTDPDHVIQFNATGTQLCPSKLCVLETSGNAATHFAFANDIRALPTSLRATPVPVDLPPDNPLRLLLLRKTVLLI